MNSSPEISTVNPVEVVLLSGNSHAATPTYTVLRLLTTPTTVTSVIESHHDDSHTLFYSLITLGVLALALVVAVVAFCIYRRSKLDRIRHHLMPMYTFDPADDEAHWEADLLEDDREQQIALNSVLPENRPKLKFHSNVLET